MDRVAAGAVGAVGEFWLPKPQWLRPSHVLRHYPGYELRPMFWTDAENIVTKLNKG